MIGNSVSGNAHEKNLLEFTVPVMERAPRIDGEIDGDEWNEAFMFDGMTWQGRLEERSVRSYVGATHDAFYFAIVSELPEKGSLVAVCKDATTKIVHDDAFEVFVDPNPDLAKGVRYQALGNSLGAIAYLTSTRGGAKVTENWCGGYVVKQNMDNGKWIVEIKVPVSSFAKYRKTTEGVWGISLCRDWKQPGVFSSAPGDFTGENTRFRFVPGSSAIQFGFDGDPTAKQIKGTLKVKNTGNESQTMNASINTSLDVMPDVKTEERLTVSPGSTSTLVYDATANASNCEKFDFSIEVSSDKATLYKRHFKWDAPRKMRWTTEIKEVLPFDFEFAYYPYRDLIRIHNILANYKKTIPEKVEYMVVEKKTGKVIETFFVPAKDGYEARFTLPPLAGAYELSMKVGDETLTKMFERKRFEWERNKLGRSRKVFPPFTPIQVEGETVSTVLREHSLGKNGLPKRISVKNVDLLAEPIELKLNGETFAGEDFSFTEIAEDVVRTKSRLKSKNFSASTVGRWEIDGALKYELTLHPTNGKKIERLSLEIPLNDKIVTMAHALTDVMRDEKATFAIPPGQGVVWDSSRTKVFDLPNGFCAYLFLGSPLRGLCFFADNDKNWGWSRKTPSMELVRRGQVITLRVNLIDEPLAIKKPRTITWGLLAAPIKPRLADWRTRWLDGKYCLLGTDINWLGGPGCCSNVYPPGRDLHFWKQLARSNVEKLPREEMRECEQRGFKYFEPFPNAQERKRSWSRHVYHNLGGARYGKSMVFYYNRAVFNALDEYPTFMNEWILPDFFPRVNPLSVGEIKIVPSESYNDFAVHWYAKSFEHGRNRGVYWDNWFLRPSYNTEMTDAYYRADGSITPACGIWQLRELAKRTFQMMGEKGMTPIIWPHMTSTSVLPMLSFATVQLDWEWKYSTGDTQYRFSRPYCAMVSNGELAGVIPVMLEDHGKQAKDEWTQRTFAGVCLIHELQSHGGGKVWKSLYERVLREYAGASNDHKAYDSSKIVNPKPELRVHRYWDENVPVHASDPDYAWILYSLPGERALLIVCGYKERSGKVSFELDLKRLGLPENSVGVNFETGEKIDLKSIEIEKHGVVAIEVKAP